MPVNKLLRQVASDAWDLIRAGGGVLDMPNKQYAEVMSEVDKLAQANNFTREEVLCEIGRLQAYRERKAEIEQRTKVKIKAS